MRRLTVFFVVALFAGACGDSADTTTTTEAPEATAATQPPATTEPPATTQATTTTAAATTTQPESEESLPSDLEEFSPFEAGTYTMGELGTPVTFTVTGDWSTQPATSGFFVITTPNSAGPGDHDMVFARPTGLFDATSGLENLEADDLDGWLATVPDTVSVFGPTRLVEITRLGFEIMVGDDVCGEREGGCIPMFRAGGSVDQFLDPGFLYEVFWIEHPDGPIVVVNGTPEDDPDWLDVARGVVSTLEIG